ncbi:MAG TPA: hypothetical protein VN040_21985, partial [Pseudosphingobacterium sp.]|nr:hypothetical protein [Pseudosphingobacterium sp.]
VLHMICKIFSQIIVYFEISFAFFNNSSIFTAMIGNVFSQLEISLDHYKQVSKECIKDIIIRIG